MIIIFDLGGGLCNQINDIVYSLTFCIKNNIQFSFRYCKFRCEDLCTFYDVPFGKLFDYTFLNKYSLYRKFEEIHPDISSENTFNLSPCYIADRIFDKNKDILPQIQSINSKYIILKQFWAISRRSLQVDSKLFSTIKPAEHIVEIYNTQKNLLKLENNKYNYIHYRYEYDFTRHFKITVEKLDLIIEKINSKFNNKECKIYIATSNIDKLINLQDKKYANIIFKDTTHLKGLNFEELAYIDFLFGLYAFEIYGHSMSSFSRVLNLIKQSSNYYDLID